MKIELELSEAELNSLNAALRMMDKFINDKGVFSTFAFARCKEVQHHFFANSGFGEPTTEEIDALVHKIIGGEE